MEALVPSTRAPTALALVHEQLGEAVSVSVAVAFVTNSGVDLLAAELAKRAPVGLEVCARGAPITEQAALLRLRDDLGANVTLAVGRASARFHPKLWLVRSETTLSVLSGSGNLTRGGLLDNVEQFEFRRFPIDSDVADQHERRYEELVAGAVPLDEVRTSPYWYEWERQARKRAQLERQLQELDDELVSRKAGGREADKLLLLADLQALYERTVAARLPRADGKSYVPSYFKRGLDNARAAGNPVPLVARICDRQTEGFDVILASGAPELTVEALVVDPDKPYHDLFSEKTRRLAQERLRKFPS